MTTKLVKTLETDTPLAEIQARWAHVALYGDIMPSVRRIKPLGHQRWLWQTADREWTIEGLQQRTGQLVSWHARSDDIDCEATVLMAPLRDGRGTRLVYTLHYLNGLPDGSNRASIEADMQTTLRRSAGLLDRPQGDSIDVPDMADVAAALSAAQPSQALAQVVESGETLQATLSEAADAWARSMTDSIKLINATMWPARAAGAAPAALLPQAQRQKEQAAASELQT